MYVQSSERVLQLIRERDSLKHKVDEVSSKHVRMHNIRNYQYCLQIIRIHVFCVCSHHMYLYVSVCLCLYGIGVFHISYVPIQ